uniref:Putative nuclease HARBI1 n=1 Tax=Ditylenchus dipsaci TaxID=166011 RepID=A0A915CMQ2_9BILA
MSTSDESFEEERIQGPRQRVFRPRAVVTDPMQFRERFRLTSRQADVLLGVIGERLQPSTFRSNPMSPKVKLLCALRFYASNSFFYNVGDAQGPSKKSVDRAIRQVTSVINAKLSDRIKWPADEGVCRRIASNFLQLANPGMPTVCGAVDGTLIKLAYCPSEHEFVDRHQQHSINAMVVAGPNYRFYFLSAKWPGSVSDARVLRNSSMAIRFNAGWRPFPGAVLLGDSIYGASDSLVPMRPHAPQQYDPFYKYHSKTRRVVKCAFGLWKNRFQCLKSGMRLKSPTYCGEVIMACGYLHNFLMEERLEQENDDDEFMEQLALNNLFVMERSENISANKDVLFGKFSESITKKLKDDTWEMIRKELVAEGYASFQAKTSKQLRESMWSQTKTRTMEKVDKSKKTGGVKFSEVKKYSSYLSNDIHASVEKLLLAIISVESPQVKGMDVSESGEVKEDAPPTPKVTKERMFADVLNDEVTPRPVKKRLFADVSKPSFVDDEIKAEKLRKLKLENRLMELFIYEKELELGVPPEQRIFANRAESVEKNREADGGARIFI